jgi:hypothetical protein
MLSLFKISQVVWVLWMGMMKLIGVFQNTPKNVYILLFHIHDTIVCTLHLVSIKVQISYASVMCYIIVIDKTENTQQV